MTWKPLVEEALRKHFPAEATNVGGVDVALGAVSAIITAQRALSGAQVGEEVSELLTNFLFHMPGTRFYQAHGVTVQTIMRNSWMRMIQSAGHLKVANEVSDATVAAKHRKLALQSRTEAIIEIPVQIMCCHPDPDMYDRAVKLRQALTEIEDL